MSNLTDIQLRKKLEAYGEDVGPLTTSTRGLWERRLKKLESSGKVLISLSPEIYLASIGSEPVENCIYKRNLPVNSTEMSNTISSEDSSSTFDVVSPLVGEPGNSPYPFRAKLDSTPLRNRRRVESVTPNVELPDKSKIWKDSPTMDKKLRSRQKIDTSKETKGDSEEEFLESIDKDYLAESSVRYKSEGIHSIARCVQRLLKLGYYALIILIVILFMSNNSYSDDETKVGLSE